MFKNKTTPTLGYDEKIKAAKYDCVLQALKEIVKIEVKGADSSGKEVINHAATVTSIKTRARLALDFVGNLDKKDDDD